ncbi:MAG: hypothetical protein IPO08_21580 [Xanthomonadales bacterium]|nr:hypothetical protein [Xanthomonadales bacterium]
MRIPGASWGDVTRDGRIVAACPDGDGWALCLLPEQTPLTRCPDRLMFVRVDTGPDGRLAATAQGHRDGAWWLWVEGRPWVRVGDVGGAHCVEIVGTAWEWQVFGQLTATTYRVLTVLGDGLIGSSYDGSMPATSQGFGDASAKGYLWRDPVLRIGDVMQPVPAGAWLVGQHKDDPPRCVLADTAGTVARVVYEGECESPRAAWVNGALVVYGMGNYEGVVERGAVSDFPVYQAPVVPPPVPVPPPVVTPPRPEEPSMSVMETLQTLRRGYGASMSDDECVALCNAAAWAHRGDPEQWGLSFKASGTHGVRHDGTPCCHDVLVRKDTGEEYDVLAGAGPGGASTPTWGKTGGRARPGREWVAPIQPLGLVTPVPPPTPGTSPTPTPVPQPPPVSTPCQYAPVDLSLVLASLQELRAKQDVTDARVDALRERLEAINAEMHGMVVGQVNGLLQAIQAVRR